MQLLLEGKTHGLKWSAAHIIPNHPKCGRMHGHDYVMDIKITIQETQDVLQILKEKGFILDYGDIKSLAKLFIAPLDHKFLIPDDPKIMGQIGNEEDNWFEYYGQGIILNERHLAKLPILLVSSENLSQYAQMTLSQSVNNLLASTYPQLQHVVRVNVAIFEGEGQGAWF